MVTASEFQRGRKEEPHRKKARELNKVASLAPPVLVALQAPKFWVESAPFSMAVGTVLVKGRSRRPSPSCSARYSEKSKVESLSRLSS